ncbi:MAG TPA: hypothetical protein VL551_12130 [Actinospica sp.]|nr:hypothetical protein [Actinospica sp.]
MGDGVYAGALSDTAATGLILGAGALGSGLLVLGLTVLAVRRGNREEELRRRGEAERARARRTAARIALIEPGAHDPYPQQPYSPTEPKSHQPYSRPYKLPRQGSLGATNGHVEPQRERESPATED